MNDFKSGLQSIANGLLEKSQTENLIIKLGAEGLIALKKCPRLATDSLSAFNTNPKDVAGAGDALLSTAASIFLKMIFGNFVSGVHCCGNSSFKD